MSYIIKLREKAGTMPLIMVGSTVMIKDKEERILLQKRSDTGLWSTIGGAMEIGESFEETAIREVKEETSLIIEKLVSKCVLSGKDMNMTYPNGDEVYVVTEVFEVTEWTGKPKVNDLESLEFRFFDLQKEKPEIAPLAKKILEKTGYIN
jgi:ADP-ribose pyrophosphatase YjhB (NUDIX family)